MWHVQLVGIIANLKPTQHVLESQFFIFQRRSQASVGHGMSVMEYVGESTIEKQGCGYAACGYFFGCMSDTGLLLNAFYPWGCKPNESYFSSRNLSQSAFGRCAIRTECIFHVCGHGRPGKGCLNVAYKWYGCLLSQPMCPCLHSTMDLVQTSSWRRQNSAL